MNVGRPEGGVTFDNRGRVVLITGGARGIGRAVAEEFLLSGATVICADVDTQAAATLPKAIAFQETDVSSEPACERLVGWVIETFGGIDVLVNNAAIQPAESYRRSTHSIVNCCIK